MRSCPRVKRCNICVVKYARLWKISGSPSRPSRLSFSELKSSDIGSEMQHNEAPAGESYRRGRRKRSSRQAINVLTILIPAIDRHRDLQCGKNYRERIDLRWVCIRERVWTKKKRLSGARLVTLKPVSRYALETEDCDLEIRNRLIR